MRMKKMLKYGWVLSALFVSLSAAAIDRDQVWVHEVDRAQVGVALADSPQANMLRSSLIQPWLNTLPGGTRLTEKNGSIENLPVLHIPLAT